MAAVDPLQTPLPRVERDPGRMIEMRMRDEDVGHAQDGIRPTSDVQRDSELAHAGPGLMSGARTPVDREVLGGEPDGLPVLPAVDSIPFPTSLSFSVVR